MILSLTNLRPSRTSLRALGLAAVATAAILVGQHSRSAPVPVPSAFASCFAGWPGCAGNDPTRTSTLRVLHLTTGGTRVVPNTQEIWTATATYSPTNPPACTDLTPVTVTITVTNNGNGYSVACPACGGGSVFTAVGICALTLCANGTDYDYTIKLDMLQSSAATYDLHTVAFASASIANGNTIDSSCNTVSAVTPTSQVWTATDTTFPCSYDCTNDTLITITY